jgi:hypothetical protein
MVILTKFFLNLILTNLVATEVKPSLVVNENKPQDVSHNTWNQIPKPILDNTPSPKCTNPTILVGVNTNAP